MSLVSEPQKIPPEEAGWICTDKAQRLWLLPDGSYFQFPPNAECVLLQERYARANPA